VNVPDDRGLPTLSRVHSAPAESARFGLALSGGGFRAASFHLGVLKRLDELGLLSRVTMLSCVSGGSVVGALYALRKHAHPTYSVATLIDELRPVLTGNLRGRALFGTLPRAAQTVTSVVWPRVSRIGLIAEELDRCLYNGASLSEMPPWVLLNATNLRTGKAWKFFNDRAGDYIVGATDRTGDIRVADAVAASAAYPGLADAFRFHVRPGELRPELLDRRWGTFSDKASLAGGDWRARFMHLDRPDVMPLVDGGAYDNEGLIGLRSVGVTHAIISSSAPPEDDARVGWWPYQISRMVEVIHSRLGGATRQLAHEITHEVDLGLAGRELRQIAEEIDALADQEPRVTTQRELRSLARRVTRQIGVELPLRGHQFLASVPILLNKTELAVSRFVVGSPDGLDVPQEFRGCERDIVRELARVRTDLDALEEPTVNLLIAQGYFAADAYCKVCMPEVVKAISNSEELYSRELAPRWQWATDVVAACNADVTSTIRELRAAQRPLQRGNSPRPDEQATDSAIDVICGRSQSREEAERLRIHLIAVSIPIVMFLAIIAAWLGYGLLRLASWMFL
jgi:NTE family protein